MCVLIYVVFFLLYIFHDSEKHTIGSAMKSIRYEEDDIKKYKPHDTI